MVLDGADQFILVMLQNKSAEFRKLRIEDLKILVWLLAHQPTHVKSWIDYLNSHYQNTEGTILDNVKLLNILEEFLR
jgi:hypothetical protein